MRLPGSFLPEEDQGYLISMIQLPPGATQERTVEVVSQVEDYYLKQPEVAHVIGVVGFSFFGRARTPHRLRPPEGLGRAHGPTARRQLGDPQKRQHGLSRASSRR
jgi:multidrug efflux pump subunit AcrB